MSTKTKRIGGTPANMAPEVWMAYAKGGSFGMKCDIYSLGVVLYQLLTNKLPFMIDCIEPAKWLELIEKGPPLEPLQAASEDAVSLIVAMLAGEAKRPTARNCLRYPWFALKAQKLSGQLTSQQIDALVRYKAKNEFQKSVILQVASQVKAADVPGIASLFRKYDADNSGYLEMSEMVSVLCELGISRSIAEEAADAIDLDKDGRIAFTEFLAACMSNDTESLDAYLKPIFTKLDKDGSGTLTVDEIMKLLAKVSREASV